MLVFWCYAELHFTMVRELRPFTLSEFYSFLKEKSHQRQAPALGSAGHPLASKCSAQVEGEPWAHVTHPGLVYKHSQSRRYQHFTIYSIGAERLQKSPL